MSKYASMVNIVSILQEAIINQQYNSIDQFK